MTPTLYPFVVSTLTWESRPGQWNLTVCLKATYALSPGAAEPCLAPQKDGSHDDVLFEQAPHASLYSPSDFVPFKSRADVLLVGQAHAPGGAPVDSLMVRLRLGDFSKVLRVTGDRAWVDTPQGPRASAPRPFTRMPLRYERAWRKGENLAGVPGGDATRPPASIDIVTEDGPAETPGFGPIAPSWRAFRDPRVREALIWGQRIRTGPRHGPAPTDIDGAVFNCAPRDQQLADIAPGAPLVLDNLHPRSPRLETRLPSLLPKVFHVDPATGQPREVSARIDTVWIDTDREVVVVSWRGVVGIVAPAAGAGRVLVAAHAQGQTVTFDEVEALVRAGSVPVGDAPATTTRPSAARRAPPATAQLPQMAPSTGAPFPLATPAATPDPSAAPIAGAPWAAEPAAPVPRPGKNLAETLPLGASLVHMILPARAPEGPSRATRKAPSTIVLQRMPARPRTEAPFPLAEPGGRPSAAPVAGAPWAGIAAAPVPRPDQSLAGTLPLGVSLSEAMAKAIARGAAAPVAPAMVVAAAPVEPPVPFVAPEPVSPTAAPPAKAARPAAAATVPGPAVRKRMYGDFTRKQR